MLVELTAVLVSMKKGRRLLVCLFAFMGGCLRFRRRISCRVSPLIQILIVLAENLWRTNFVVNLVTQLWVKPQSLCQLAKILSFVL